MNMAKEVSKEAGFLVLFISFWVSFRQTKWTEFTKQSEKQNEVTGSLNNSDFGQYPTRFMPAYLSTSEAPAPSLALKYLAASHRSRPLQVHKRGTKETLFLSDGGGGGEIGQTKSDAAGLRTRPAFDETILSSRKIRS